MEVIVAASAGEGDAVVNAAAAAASVVTYNKVLTDKDGNGTVAALFFSFVPLF